MTPKERIYAILNREPVDRMPVDLWCTPEVLDTLRAYTGKQDELSVYNTLGLDKIVWIFPGYGGRYFDPNDSGEITMWGVPTRMVKAGLATYQEYINPPLANYETPAQLDAYPAWPNPDLFDYAGAKALADEARSWNFATIGPWISHFEIYCQMRGLENAMIDTIANPEFLDATLDRIDAIQTQMLERILSELGDRLDIVFISDDMGMQENLLISLESWEMYFKPRLKKWCDLIHRYGKKVLYHTDGASFPIIPGLVDCGVDILNPIQHVCQGMDMTRLKQLFGKNLIFHGGIENQQVLPRGTVQDVIDETRNCLESLGGDGEGYICCSCHNAQAGTPVENILAMIDTVKKFFIILFLLVTNGELWAQKPDNNSFDVSRYNVEWNSPGKDATASMPIGNGDLGANVYTTGNGDLYLLLGKTDAFDWNGNVWKTGRVRIRINPNPFRGGVTFKQTLNLAEGSIDITSFYRISNHQIKIKVWVDANRPVYHINIQSLWNIDINVVPEFWEREDGSFDRFETIDNQLIWYHANGERSCYPDDLKYYEIEDMLNQHPDPFKRRTFGCAMQVEGLTPENGSFAGFGKSFSIEIASLTKQVENTNDWIKETRNILAGEYDRTLAFQKHCEWWKSFWNTSWITASDNTLPPNERETPAKPAEPGKRGEKDGGYIVAQSYNIARFIMACQGRGKYQTQFNGGIFTMPFPDYRVNDGSLFGEDERDWGNRFTFQNQRLMYWPMLAAGDFEMMRPFFNYYFSILDLRKKITQQWFGHEGAYYRENIQLTGAEIDDSPHSANKPPKTKKGEPLPPGWYHNYHFNSGLELAVMALELYRYSQNEAFFRDTVVPLSREVIRFFDRHYDRDNQGKLLLYPSQVLETWWNATNPTTDVAGLHYLIEGLLKEKNIPQPDRKDWEKLRKQLPAIALATEDGKQYILPAAKFEHRANMENGELYAVFPYSLFGVGHGTEDIVAKTMEKRLFKNSFDYRCWTQDQIMYAYAGMSEEAKDGLIHRWSTYSKHLRLPMFGTEGPDYVPDFDHNGSGSVALQRMVVQEVGNKIYVLPAWPKEWDGSFKLRLHNNAVIQGAVKNGKVENLNITPENRRKDIVVVMK